MVNTLLALDHVLLSEVVLVVQSFSAQAAYLFGSPRDGSNNSLQRGAVRC